MLWINLPRMLLIFVVLILIQVWRSREEERVLTEEVWRRVSGVQTEDVVLIG